MTYRRAHGDRAGRGGGWGWFLAWLAVGACGAAGCAAVLSVGPALLVPAAVAAGLLLRKGPRTAAAGALAGLALPLCYLAHLNRGGPGNVCRAVPGGRTCTEEYAPLPFLVAGVMLFAAGFVVFLVLDRNGRARPPGR